MSAPIVRASSAPDVEKNLPSIGQIRHVKKKAFLENFRLKAGNVSAICAAVGVSRSNYYWWLQNDETFATLIRHERESLIDFVESHLMGKIQKGSDTAIIFFLKCRGKHRGWIDNPDIRVEVTDGETIRTESESTPQLRSRIRRVLVQIQGGRDVVDTGRDRAIDLEAKTE